MGGSAVEVITSYLMDCINKQVRNLYFTFRFRSKICKNLNNERGDWANITLDVEAYDEGHWI